MVTGAELVEAAKALTGPATKLIEVVAAGCGRVYGPTDIRRRAQAEADALLVMEEAKARASEAEMRAAHRLMDVEMARQENLDQITQKAHAALPNEVSGEPVDRDWSTRFVREAQDVSNEDMQRLWAKVLAGEVAKPGSFSPRTLTVLSQLTTNEAQLFETLCSLRFELINGPSYLFHEHSARHFLDSGLHAPALIALEAAGLVRADTLGMQYANETERHFVGPDQLAYSLTSDTPRSLSLGNLSLTPAGAELARLTPMVANGAHLAHVLRQWRSQGWTVTCRHIVGWESAGARVGDEVPLPADQPPT